MNLRLIITLLCVLMTKIQPEVAQKITWEDLRMIAAQDEEMTIASKALYEKNQDKYARIWAQAHEDFLAEERMLVNRVKDAESKAKQAESKAKQAESKAEHLRALLIANNIDPDSTL